MIGKMYLKENNFISRADTRLLKGVAIILMLVYHFFTFPEWYISGIGYSYSAILEKYLYGPTQWCVALFAFITGYTYYYNANKSLFYSILKVKKLLINYWILLLLLTSVALYFNKVELNVLWLKEILAFSNGQDTVMVFAWYIQFYIVVILFLPIYIKYISKSLLYDFCTGILFWYGLKHLIMGVEYTGFLRTICLWMPYVFGGWMVAKYNLYFKITDKFKLRNRSQAFYYTFTFLFFVSGVTRSHLAKYLLLPIFVLFLIYLLNNCNQIIKLVLNEFGKYSMEIWFLHCMFFNITKEIFQPIAFYPGNPVLVLIWVMLLCLGMAKCIDLTKSKILECICIKRS